MAGVTSPPPARVRDGGGRAVDGGMTTEEVAARRQRERFWNASRRDKGSRGTEPEWDGVGWGVTLTSG